IAALEHAVRDGPFAQDGFALGRAYATRGDLARAGNAIGQTSKTDPTGYAYEMEKEKAMNEATAGHHEAAIAGLTKAVAAAPEDINNRVMLGQALVFAGRAQEALPQFDFVLRHSPKEPAALYGRGLALGKLGRNEEALQS